MIHWQRLKKRLRFTININNELITPSIFLFPYCLLNIAWWWWWWWWWWWQRRRWWIHLPTAYIMLFRTARLKLCRLFFMLAILSQAPFLGSNLNTVFRGAILLLYLSPPAIYRNPPKLTPTRKCFTFNYSFSKCLLSFLL